MLCLFFLVPRPIKVHGGTPEVFVEWRIKLWKLPGLGPTPVVMLGLLEQHAIQPLTETSSMEKWESFIFIFVL